MPFVVVDHGSVLYDEDTEQVAMFVSRQAANLALTRVLASCPEAEIIEVQLEKK